MQPGTTAPRAQELAFAACVMLILSVGVVGVLLLNTAMQQQSDQMVSQHQRIAALTQRVQDLQQQLDRQSDPARLAARARALHLRPVTRIQYVNAQRRAAAPVHEG